MGRELAVIVVTAFLVVLQGDHATSAMCSSGSKCARFGNAGYRLYDKLLRRYNRFVRPVADMKDVLNVKFGMAILEVSGLQERTANIGVRLRIRMSWKDHFLTWNPSDYGDITTMYLPAKKIWIPDIKLFNSRKDDVDMDVNAVIKPDGAVTLTLAGTFYITCRHVFRGNSWNCPFRFGSWTYDAFKVDLQALNGLSNIDMSDYSNSEQWAVLASKGNRHVVQRDCCDEPYVTMDYDLTLRAKLGTAILGRKK